VLCDPAPFRLHKLSPNAAAALNNTGFQLPQNVSDGLDIKRKHEQAEKRRSASVHTNSVLDEDIEFLV